MEWITTGPRAIASMIGGSPMEAKEVKGKAYGEVLKYVQMPTQRESFLDRVSVAWMSQHTMAVIGHLLATVKTDAFSEWQLAAEDAMQNRKVEETKKQAVSTLKDAATLSQSAGKWVGALTLGGSVFAPQAAKILDQPWMAKGLSYVPKFGETLSNPVSLSTGKEMFTSWMRNSSQFGASQVQAYTQSFQAAQYAVQTESQMEQQKLQEIKGKQQSQSGMKSSMQEALTRLQQQQDGIAQATKVSAGG